MSEFEPRFTTASEVAKIFKVSPRTIGNWIELGKMSALKLPGGHYRIPLDEVKRIAAEGYKQRHTSP